MAEKNDTEEAKRNSMTVIDREMLRNMVPLSDRTILDMEKRGEFPRRFALTKRRVGWKLIDVEKWLKERETAGNQVARPATA